MKKYIAVVAVLLVFMVGISRCRGEDVDAAGYVQANLDLIFQGETQGAKEFLEVSNQELEQMHDNGIYAFVETYLTGGMDTEGTYAQIYDALMEQIFLAMKYRVGEAKQTDAHTWEVPVWYSPVDVFLKFIPGLKKEAEKIEQAAHNGEYQGTDEEIQQSMMVDYLNHSYTYLEAAYLDMSYMEEQKYIFTVTEEKGVLHIQEGQLNILMERIFALDKR